MWKRFSKVISSLSTKEKASPSPHLVAERFRRLFVEHGVSETQIPRVFPKIKLEDLISNETLIKKLDPDTLNGAASLFNVCIEWLEGIDDRIYRFYSCYKHPELFIEQFSNINPSSDPTYLRVVTSAKTFDFNSEDYQPFVLAILEPIFELGDDVIYRYKLDSLWGWQHQPCRIQAKAMAYIYRKTYRNKIPIFHTDDETLEKISQGLVIPRAYLSGCLITEPSLEDYVMTPKQSVVSKESEELPAVLEYIERNNLSEIKVQNPTSPDDVPSEQFQPNVDEFISKMNRKNAKARYASLDIHKAQFKEFFSVNGYTNKSQAARDYFSKLTPEDKKVVVPSYYEQDHQNCLTKAVRTLTASLKQ